MCGRYSRDSHYICSCITATPGLGGVVALDLWLSFGAAQGNKYAIKRLNVVTMVMTDAEIEEAKRLAADCLKQNYKNCRR